MRNKLLYIPLAGLTLLAATAAIALSFTIKSWYTDQVALHLEDIALATIDHLKDDHEHDHGHHHGEEDPEIVALTDMINHLAGHNRITIIDKQGVVLADSKFTAKEVTTLENHSDRPEIIKALSTGRGQKIHASTVLDYDQLYVALRYRHNGETGIVRASTSLEKLQQTLQQLYILIALVTMFLTAAMAAVTYRFSRYLDKEISKERQGLEQRVLERTQDIEQLQRLASLLASCQNFEEAQQVVQNLVPNILGSCNGAWTGVRHGRVN